MDLLNFRCHDDAVQNVVTWFEEYEEDLARNAWFPICLRNHFGPFTRIMQLPDCNLQLGKKQYELYIAVSECLPKVEMDGSMANVVALTLCHTMTIRDVRITGELQIIENSRVTTTTRFKLHIPKVEVQFLGDMIFQSGSQPIFNMNNVSNVVLEYLDEHETWIPILDNNNTDALVNSHLANHFLRPAGAFLNCQFVCSVRSFQTQFLHTPTLYECREAMRMYKKTITKAFNQLVENILDLANTHMVAKDMNLPIFSTAEETQTGRYTTYEFVYGCASGLNSLTRVSNPIITRDANGDLVLFVHVDLSDITIKYKEYTRTPKGKYLDPAVRVIPFRHQSYMKITLNRINADRARLKLTEFKMYDIRFKTTDPNTEACTVCHAMLREDRDVRLSDHFITWINYVLPVLIAPNIENHISNAIKAILGTESLQLMAVRPNNLESYYEDLSDSDDDDFISDPESDANPDGQNGR